MGLLFGSDEEVLAAIYTAMLSEPCERELAQQDEITLERFVDYYSDSLVVGLKIEGELAGGMYFHHPGRVHIGILPRFRSRWAVWLQPMLSVGFEKFGPRMKTLVNARNVRAQKFLERTGCVRVRTLPHAIEYDVVEERMRYGRIV